MVLLERASSVLNKEEVWQATNEGRTPTARVAAAAPIRADRAAADSSPAGTDAVVKVAARAAATRARCKAEKSAGRVAQADIKRQGSFSRRISVGVTPRLEAAVPRSVQTEMPHPLIRSKEL